MAQHSSSSHTKIFSSVHLTLTNVYEVKALAGYVTLNYLFYNKIQLSLQTSFIFLQSSVMSLGMEFGMNMKRLLRYHLHKIKYKYFPRNGKLDTYL